ncbi:MAG TPA: DNA replication/repair protein RecF [Candidatus Saccharimonadales bacterium]|nr:DNA replication/repair protein RecF [Candidatus Saccharimonadales bacterium]
MISSLRAQNFRSYADASFEFTPGVNIVVGPNASGKTNLLEAVLVLCRGGSYRARDPELVKFNKSWARLDGYFDNQTRTYKYASEQAEKNFVIDDKPYKRLSLDKSLPVVWFEPNHLQLLIRGPEQRRDYFDELLERTQPGFKQQSSAYRRALAQRNRLLKTGDSSRRDQLFVWDVRLAELGEKIAQAREALVNQINQEIAKTYSKIARSKIELSVDYQSQFKIEGYASRLLAKLGASAELDFVRGFTAYGPHREDFCFQLAGQNTNISASRGEIRSIMLALKVFELGLIEKARGQTPIFLLDDVFSELDGARRRALVDFLKNQQTIITTTDAETVVEYFSRGSQNLVTLSRSRP